MFITPGVQGLLSNQVINTIRTQNIVQTVTTGRAKINYAILTGHDKSYTGPMILKIYELIYS